jgi:ethanolamine ammonia-lyase large subunit
MVYTTTIERTVYRFADLKELMAKATPQRSGDELAGIAADGPVERLSAQMALADLPLKAFAVISSQTVGGFREWLMKPETAQAELEAVTFVLTPEMVAAVSKIMRLQDPVAVVRAGATSSSSLGTDCRPALLRPMELR